MKKFHQTNGCLKKGTCLKKGEKNFDGQTEDGRIWTALIEWNSKNIRREETIGFLKGSQFNWGDSKEIVWKKIEAGRRKLKT